jgi:peptidoglycan/LPS O-acetylase OafA/YrhL
MQLQSFKVINSPERNGAIDLFRSFAILSVVLYHFNDLLPYGFLGVDLFFVISGILVGGILSRKFSKTEKINYWRFIFQRGGKIWPSYYFFLIVGSIIAYAFYHNSNPDQIIPLWDFKRYVFFYQNFTGTPYHWSFDHVWSLCVEEHFYLVLPLMFLFVQFFFKQKKLVFLFTILAIVAGFCFKYYILKYTNSKDTYAATPNRIDALAWGVLITLLVTFYGDKIRNLKYKAYFFLLGLLSLAFFIFIDIRFDNVFYHKVLFHSLTPISFSLMILSVFYLKVKRSTKPLAVVAYYSYNWYLWHPVFVIIISEKFGKGVIGLISYLIISFFIALVATVLIEEPALKIRDRLLKKKSKVVIPVAEHRLVTENAK